MISSEIKRFILATTITAVGALYTACTPQRPEPQTAVKEAPAANVNVNEGNSTESQEKAELANAKNQQDENAASESENTSVLEVAETKEENKPIEFPIPTEADGAELLQYENITFEPDTSPIPDVAAIVRSARKTNDTSSMFITHMMYRDNIGDIAYYNNGKKQETELAKEELHREMIRWRDTAYDANFELAMLATNPSVVYETSPLFSDDDEFQKSVKWLKKAAAHGYGNAEYILGLVYFNGVGIKRDKKKGFELLVRAAAHGVINAYYAVGMIYEMGLNGKKNTDKSFYWLDKAVHFGSKDATFILAMKYYDGIDVPKDEGRASEIEKLDPKYHAWIKLRGEGFYHKYCTFQFDESAIGWTQKEYGGGECGDDVTISHSNSAGFDEDKDEYSLEETAAYSLDYKIDYLVAAKWLRKVATFERDYSYILHAQTHHITGCRGDLDGHKYDGIILYPDEYDEYDYDDYSVLFQKFIIALTDDEVKPSKLKKILMDKVEAGDPEAINLLGNLYNQPDEKEDNKDDYYDDDETPNGYQYLYEPFGIKKNIPKAFEYFEIAFNIKEEKCKTTQNIYCEVSDDDIVDAALRLAAKAYNDKMYDTAYEWYEKAFQFSIRAKNDVQAVKTTDKAADQSNLKGHQDIKKQWYPQIIDLCKERYEALSHDPNTSKARIEQASKIAKYYHKLLKDDTHATEWYERTFQLSVHAKNHDKAITSAKEIIQLSSSNEHHDIEKQWYQKIIDLCKKRFEALGKGQDNANKRFDEAVIIAEYYHTIRDDVQAVEWYNKAMEISGEDNEISTMSVQHALSNIYYTADSTQVQDKAKAAQIDKEYLSNRSFYLGSDGFSSAFRLCEFNYRNEQSQNLPLAIEACKTAIEISYKDSFYTPDNKEEKIKLIREVVDKMPRIDLINEVEKQIRAEKGKTPDKFFVIEKVIIPCKTEYEFDDEVNEYRCDSIKPLYLESIKKAMTAITALSLASGSLNFDEIKNTFYYLAIYKGKDKQYREQLSNDSAVYHAFRDGDYSDEDEYHLSSENIEQLFYTWYLRQIPYAASEKFKTLNAPKTWKEYTNEAKELLKQDEQLRKAFGYDLMKDVQGFVDPDAPKQ